MSDTNPAWLAGIMGPPPARFGVYEIPEPVHAGARMVGYTEREKPAPSPSVEVTIGLPGAPPSHSPLCECPTCTDGGYRTVRCSVHGQIAVTLNDPGYAERRAHEHLQREHAGCGGVIEEV